MITFYMASSIDKVLGYGAANGIHIERVDEMLMPDEQNEAWEETWKKRIDTQCKNYYTTCMGLINIVPPERIMVISNDLQCVSLECLNSERVDNGYSNKGFLACFNPGEVFLNYTIDELFMVSSAEDADRNTE